MFVRFYERSLYWFSLAVKPLKPMLEPVKGSEPVLYGGLPVTSFEKLLAEGGLAKVETTECGWRWPYVEQRAGAGDSPPFDEWRAQALAAAEKKNAAAPCAAGNILMEIAPPLPYCRAKRYWSQPPEALTLDCRGASRLAMTAICSLASHSSLRAEGEAIHLPDEARQAG